MPLSQGASTAMKMMFVDNRQSDNNQGKTRIKKKMQNLMKDILKFATE
jgi:hypothetical protein